MLLAGALLAGALHASAATGSPPPAPDPASLSVKLDAQGIRTVSRGDFYYVDRERFDLARRTDQLVVKLRPGIQSASAISQLTAANGSLSGFSQALYFGDDLFSFERAELGSLTAEQAYAGLQTALEQLKSEPNVRWSAPVFSNVQYGTYAIATDEVLVRLKDGQSPEAFFSDTRFAGFRKADSSDAFIAYAAAGAGEGALELAALLQGDARIRWAEPNLYQERQRYSLNDPLLGDQWYLDNTGQGRGVPGADARLFAAWALAPNAGEGVVIAIVDDGTEFTHPDLLAFANPGENAGSSGTDDDGNGYINDVNGWDFTNDDNNPGPSVAGDAHGTAVAGVAAGRGDNGIGVAGPAFNASIFAARIFIGNTATSDANIGSALAYASGRGRTGANQNWRGADIVNNSWGGGPPSSAINDALTWATTNGRNGLGTPHFFATGNSGAASIGQPAVNAGTIGSVIAVGASNNFDLRSGYSQFGPQIDFISPSNGGSQGVVTVDRTGAAGYAPGDYTLSLPYDNSFGGTSSATPVAAGVGALLLGENPNLTVAQLRALMRSTADKIGPLGYDASGFNVQYGYGRINAANAVAGVNGPNALVYLDGKAVASGDALSLARFVGTTSTLSFTVKSGGVEDLELDTLAIAGDAAFSIAQNLGTASLPLGDSTAFSIEFSPTAPGTFNATASFVTNSGNHPTFQIPLSIEAIPAAIAGQVFEDWNGDGNLDAGDPGVEGIRVYVDTNDSGNFDLPNETTVTTASSLGLQFGDPPRPRVLANNLIVSGVGTELLALEVTVNLSHTYVSDVVLTLTSPDGLSIPLIVSRGGNGDNLVNTVFADDATTPIGGGSPPFTGRFNPERSLAIFNGIDPNGTWTLEATDVYQSDNGVLNNWSLMLKTSGEPQSISDPEGAYLFASLPPASYTVRTEVPGSWNVTLPADGSRTVVVTGSDTIADQDFGIARAQSAYGRIYADLDESGNFDAGVDQPLPDVLLFLDLDGNEQFSPAVNAAQTTTVNAAIPDNNVAGLSSQAAVAAIGRLVDLKVRVNITHTFVGDLILTLTAPDGTSILLINRRGSSGDNFTNTVLDDDAATSIASIIQSGAPFTGSYRPEGPLSTFDGVEINGTWTLNVADRAGLDTGSLVDWTLDFDYEPEPTVLSNAFGNYRFDTVPSDFDLRIDLPAGLILTQPDEGFYAEAVAAGETIQNRDFGLTTPPPDIFADGFE